MAEKALSDAVEAMLPYLMGGCRPVNMEPVEESGFVDVKREFVVHVIPSEVGVARKPDHETETSV